MGDVTIQQVDIHNIVWEPGIENLQDSREVFVLSSVKNDDLIAQYPQMQGKTGQDYTKVEYTQDEQRDTSDESIVVDWYYKVQRYEDVDVAEGASHVRSQRCITASSVTVYCCTHPKTIHPWIRDSIITGSSRWSSGGCFRSKTARGDLDILTS